MATYGLGCSELAAADPGAPRTCFHIRTAHMCTRSLKLSMRTLALSAPEPPAERGTEGVRSGETASLAMTHEENVQAVYQHKMKPSGALGSWAAQICCWR